MKEFPEESENAPLSGWCTMELVDRIIGGGHVFFEW